MAKGLKRAHIIVWCIGYTARSVVDKLVYFQNLLCCENCDIILTVVVNSESDRIRHRQNLTESDWFGQYRTDSVRIWTIRTEWDRIRLNRTESDWTGKNRTKIDAWRWLATVRLDAREANFTTRNGHNLRQNWWRPTTVRGRYSQFVFTTCNVTSCHGMATSIFHNNFQKLQI